MSRAASTGIPPTSGSRPPKATSPGNSGKPKRARDVPRFTAFRDRMQATTTSCGVPRRTSTGGPSDAEGLGAVDDDPLLTPSQALKPPPPPPGGCGTSHPIGRPGGSSDSGGGSLATLMSGSVYFGMQLPFLSSAPGLPLDNVQSPPMSGSIPVGSH